MNRLFKSIVLIPFNILYRLSPRLELAILFRIKQGYKLKLSNPTTFNEKLQWMKIYWSSEIRDICSDKYTVRDYVEEKCQGILTNLYWHGNNANDIPFDALPDKFVIKVTHGSGYNIICKDKNTLDKRRTIRKLNHWIKEKYMLCYGEDFYGKVRPSIIVEEYLDPVDGSENLVDYKILCFNGEPKYIWVVFDRFSKLGPQGVVFDLDWRVLDGVYMSYKLRDKNKVPKKPFCLSKLLDCARKLSKDLPHVRVDLYLVNGMVYFGEMSFSHGAGFDKIKPFEFDKTLGSMFVLPKDKAQL